MCVVHMIKYVVWSCRHCLRLFSASRQHYCILSINMHWLVNHRAQATLATMRKYWRKWQCGPAIGVITINRIKTDYLKKRFFQFICSKGVKAWALSEAFPPQYLTHLQMTKQPKLQNCSMLYNCLEKNRGPCFHVKVSCVTFIVTMSLHCW